MMKEEDHKKTETEMNMSKQDQNNNSMAKNITLISTWSVTCHIIVSGRADVKPE